MSNNAGGVAADQLRSYIERWERRQEEIEALKADQKEIMAEAKGTGFDVKTIRQIIKLRKLTQDERDEQEALLDLYKGALGMLNGTPLGDAAVRRLTQTPEPPKQSDDGQTDIEDLTKAYGAPAEDATTTVEAKPEEPPPLTVEDARNMGREAALAGKPVTDNPFPARDARRAAWDEAWCKASGSDGMDLPTAWRRSAKPKPGKGDDKKAA